MKASQRKKAGDEDGQTVVEKSPENFGKARKSRNYLVSCECHEQE